jgi:heavy metal sensor kinase
MIRTRSLRFHMMVLFCGVVGVLLASSYLAFYELVRHQVRAQLDRELMDASRPLIDDLITDSDDKDVNQLNLPNQFFEVMRTSGAVLQHSKNLHADLLDTMPLPPTSTKAVFRTVQGPDHEKLRLALIPFQRGSQNRVLAVAVPTQDSDRVLASFRRIAFLLFPLSLLVTALISGWYAGKSLSPVTALTQHAARMTEKLSSQDPGDLWQPLPIRSPSDELGLLASTFNQLFRKVSSVVGQMRLFVSDASHELRTPLSILQGETELLLAEPRSPEDYRKALQVIEEELKKLTRIVESLFTLAIADAGQLRLAREPLYLNEILEEACAMAMPLARPKNITLERDLKQEIASWGDEISLRQLFLIFLDNAIKYSPAESRIRIRLTANGGFARVEFQDEGIGIPPEHLPHIFERFYRVAQADSAEARNGGLGLAIAQAIVRAHGGMVECQSRVGAGSVFTVGLPLDHEGQARQHLG